MKKIILVAHGSGGHGTFSIPKVKTITKATVALSFDEAIAYMNSTKSVPEYSSTSFDQFGHLSDADCLALFTTVPKGNGIVNTGIHRGGDLGGPLIYALRGSDIGKDELEEFIKKNSITSVVLLACRS